MGVSDDVSSACLLLLLTPPLPHVTAFSSITATNENLLSIPPPTPLPPPPSHYPAPTTTTTAAPVHFSHHLMTDYTALECGPRLKKFKADIEEAIKGTRPSRSNRPPKQTPAHHPSNPHSSPALTPDLSPTAARSAFKTLEVVMKCIVTALDEAAPRACDLFPYNTSRGDNVSSNIGRKVVLRGLVSRPDLNGCYATIIDEPRCRRFERKQNFVPSS